MKDPESGLNVKEVGERVGQVRPRAAFRIGKAGGGCFRRIATPGRMERQDEQKSQIRMPAMRRGIAPVRHDGRAEFHLLEMRAGNQLAGSS